jgi:hypothetical protein
MGDADGAKAENANRGFLQEIFEDLEKKYTTPSPEAIALDISTFEQQLHLRLLVLVGLSMSIGGLILLKLAAIPWGIVTGCALSLAGLLALIQRNSTANNSLTQAVFPGAAFALVLMAALCVNSAPVAQALTLVLAATVTAVTLLGRVPQGGAAVFAIYVPILLFALEPANLSRTLVEALTLVAMALLFTMTKRHIAAFGAVVGALIASALEAAHHIRGDVAVTGLIVASLVAAIGYELRVRMRGDSTLRNICLFAFPVSLIYLVIWWNSPLPLFTEIGSQWLAAGIITVYETLMARKDRDPTSVSARFFWGAVSVSVAAIATPNLEDNFKLMILLGVAALVHRASTRMRNKALSRVTVFAVVGVALTSFVELGSRNHGAAILVVGAASFFALLILSRRPALPDAGPRAAQSKLILFLKRIFFIVVGGLLRLPFVAWIFFWAKTGFTWLRYFKSSSQPIGFNDILFAVAHAYGLAFVTRQFHFFFADVGLDAGMEAVASTVLAALWGAVLTFRGVIRREIYERMVGSLLLLVPTTNNLYAMRDANGEAFAWLVLSSGVAVWLVSCIVLAPLRIEAFVARFQFLRPLPVQAIAMRQDSPK